MGNLPIGQGELVTPIQMAAAYSAIANGGILRPPYIIGSVGGRPRQPAAGHRVISASTAASLRQMLEGVLAPGGTASEVSIPGYQLAGKTGTASKIDHATGEYSKTAFVASFIGFAPASNPKLLCAVVVDDAERVDLGLQCIEAVEQEPGHLDRRQRFLTIAIEQRARRGVHDILVGAHCSSVLRRPPGTVYGAAFAV